jgi:hypothetical protein
MVNLLINFLTINCFLILLNKLAFYRLACNFDGFEISKLRKIRNNNMKAYLFYVESNVLAYMGSDNQIAEK